MIVERFRQSLVGEVRALFNDSARNETPVQRAVDPFIPAGSVAWRVHGDVTTMMVGGVAALLLEMLHPSALAGVWDHSNFRKDMLGRLRRTARFLAVTTYGAHADAEAAIARVRRIHSHVTGTRPDGVGYVADDPRLLAWIHVAGAICFLDAWRRFGEPGMSAADQDAYFADVAPVALALGADPVPVTRDEAEAIIASFRPELSADARSREIAEIVLKAGGTSLKVASVQGLLGQAAIDLLPPWARSMHGLRASRLARPAVDIATFGMASTLRWAFADGYRR
ncbi:MAG: oxygenase MpaB family protein [Sphingomonadaceae bacterium]